MFRRVLGACAVMVWLVGVWSRATLAAEGNLIADPSFEEPKPRDQFGLVFKHWGGWKYEGDCEFRVGQVARTGKTSCLLFGSSQPKIRVTQSFKGLEPGRYQITAFLRGLDIGEGIWRQTTEFMFDGKYMPLKKNGTFGWTRLTYVAEIREKKDVLGPSFGLMAPGYFWIDDVAMVRVGPEVPLTPEPVLGNEERPIAPPGPLGPGEIRCVECGYRNMPDWKTCYACGSVLAGERVRSGPVVRVLTSFEPKSPFDNGRPVTEHATEGTKAWRLDKGYTVWDGPQDWSGYDDLKVDLFLDADKPAELYVEVRDRETRDYWTRVNHNTLVPPGKSTLVIPLAQLYVGEKSRPGRNLMLGAITRLVFSVGDRPPGPLYLDHLRLERDVETPAKRFDGLYAFDFGPAQSPLMPGFTRIDPSTVYGKGRGYGLKGARIWRAFDALQPEPLYQDFLCIEQGGLAVDVPNGTYHVMVNLDSPSGFWGEYQVYQSRAVLAEGKVVAEDRMTLDGFKRRYFRFWDVEDSPDDDTFDKYQRPYFQEKEFDVEVKDGQLNLDFRGENWACSVSAVVIYPAAKAAQGRAFLEYVAKKRRFFFDNYFHRILHKPTGDPLAPTATDAARGYVVFTRDYMEDVYYNDTPRRGETDRPVAGEGFAGEHEPLTVAICPLEDLGRVTVSISDLAGPGTIPAACASVGYVSYRLSRVAMDGTVYTIEPRLILSLALDRGIDVRKGVTRRFWLTLCPPDGARPGLYRGTITIRPEKGQPARVPVEYRVYAGTLDPVDIPAGPWGHEINLPWLGEDPATRTWNETMAQRSMKKLRQYGFTTLSGLPRIAYRGFKDGRPIFDFTQGDRQMAMARACGFTMPVVSYVPTGGLNLYYKDEAAMRAAGFDDYPRFIKAVFGAIQAHAEAAGWLPVYWNLGDEPIGDDLRRAAENAEAYRAAFPKGPPWFTAATSFASGKADDPHFRFGKAVHVANLNLHDEPSVRMLQQAGGGWAFYNGGNRWTYGVYLYKAAKEFDLKFRLSWHWNVVAGDPYYALDCREDDYAWCNTNPEGELIPSIHFEREMREGLDDYRHVLTLARLAKEKNDAQAQTLLRKRLGSFQLGQRDHDALWPVSDWRAFRRQVAEARARRGRAG
ncbi:MAG: hypothetical protein NUV77_16900 [Thermoguttaceae bacterium]|nr:hypothetical protein [Thermoguttaceae bacterium]